MKRFVLGVALAATVAASPVRAQGPPTAEIAGGYQWVRDGDNDQTFPRGWFVSGAAVVSSRPKGRVSIVGELGESRFDEPLQGGILSAGFSGSQLAYLGGVRFGRGAGAIRPFVQALAGGARLSAVFETEDLDFRLVLSDTVFVVQPGGGVDLAISDRVAVRLMADYRYLGAGSFGVDVESGIVPIDVGSVDVDPLSVAFDAGNGVRAGAGLVVTF